eukprot:6329547-Alexandrium_andersonii.AAC.1
MPVLRIEEGVRFGMFEHQMLSARGAEVHVAQHTSCVGGRFRCGHVEHARERESDDYIRVFE